ncbi:unnamed protein product [Clavelina lepadiformis]|uniref:Uncharacterized protein n=1 Tax=Clavelina lepadiformis TaxID=159417 RepID=A0ABP0G2K7_CLALP
MSELRDFTLEQAIEKFDQFVDTACFLELTGAEMQIFPFTFSVNIIKYKDAGDGIGFSSEEQNAGDESAKLVMLLLCYLANGFCWYSFIWPQFLVELFSTHFHKERAHTGEAFEDADQRIKRYGSSVSDVLPVVLDLIAFACKSLQIL